jgi:hypothetical protein
MVQPVVDASAVSWVDPTAHCLVVHSVAPWAGLTAERWGQPKAAPTVAHLAERMGHCWVGSRAAWRVAWLAPQRAGGWVVYLARPSADPLAAAKVAWKARQLASWTAAELETRLAARSVGLKAASSEVQSAATTAVLTAESTAVCSAGHLEAMLVVL